MFTITRYDFSQRRQSRHRRGHAENLLRIRRPEIGLNNPKDKRSFTKIQSAIHKEKLNIVNATGQIHIYKIKKSLNNPMNGNIKIRHYLFEVEKFADGDTEFMAIIDKIGVNGNLVGG